MLATPSCCETVFRSSGLLLYSRRRSSRDDFKVRNAGKLGQDFVLDSIGKVSVLLIARSDFQTARRQWIFPESVGTPLRAVRFVLPDQRGRLGGRPYQGLCSPPPADADHSNRMTALAIQILLFGDRASEFGFAARDGERWPAVPMAARFETTPSERRCFSIPLARVSQSASPPHCESGVPHPSTHKYRLRRPVVRCAKRCSLRRRKHRHRDAPRRQYECRF